MVVITAGRMRWVACLGVCLGRSPDTGCLLFAACPDHIAHSLIFTIETNQMLSSIPGRR